MPRLRILLECLAQAVIDHARPALLGRYEFGSSLLPVARNLILTLEKRLPRDSHRGCLQDAISVPSHTLALAVDDAIQSLSVPFEESDREPLVQYLTRLPDSLRQAIRRPGDFDGTSVPERLELEHPEDWLALLPDRVPRFRDEDRPELLDNWKLQEFRGFGNGCEVWLGHDVPEAEFPTACLKFVTDPQLKENFERHEEHFVRILDLDPVPSVIPLRSVYLLTDPPCLEYPYFHGYDLAGVMNDWRWRQTTPRPDQAILILRRLARAVAKLHRLDPPVVHGGLKPSNILANPTDDGKVSLLIGDLGWGILSTLGSLNRSDPVTDARQARRGALNSLYLSPQVRDGQLFSPRDDVYALGMIWYQLLKRNPAESPPTDNSWAMEFREFGLSDGQARLIAACISSKPEHRPKDAGELASHIEANLNHGMGLEGSKTFQLTGSSTVHPALQTPEEIPEEVAEPPRNPRTKSRSTPPEQVRRASLINLPPRFANSLGMQFALIPAGSFLMGSPEGEKGRHGWEGPQHQVTLRRPLYMGLTPVTQSQYQQVMGRNPSAFSKTRGGSPEHPVEQISWHEAMEFCQRLMAVAKEAEQMRIYRLPTEAEWEYACRADTQSAYAFGPSISLKQAHFFGMDSQSWKKEVNLVGKTCKVASYPPNLWQLFDMHGNVLEWCMDYWSEDYYEESPEEDPPGPSDGIQRVVRGGSFSQFASDCRSAARLGRSPNSKMNTLGFRVVMVVQE